MRPPAAALLPTAALQALVARHHLYDESHLSVEETLASTPDFAQFRGACLRHVAGGFREARSYVDGSLEDKRPLEAFRQAWDAHAYESQGLALPELRADLLKQRRWGRLLEQTKYAGTCGILMVDSKKMRLELQVRPDPV